MKKFKLLLNNINELLIVMISNVAITYYKVKNRNKPRVLIYTDSRGHEITSKFNKKNPFSSYCRQLIKTYNSTVYICPEKHTTIIDFLSVMKKQSCKFDLIILHCGVVDFSRRPVSQLASIYSLKHEKMLEIGFTDEELEDNTKQSTGYYYKGEKTASIYTTQQFSDIIIPALCSINNLVFIGCNKVLLNWSGTYWQERPKDINVIMDYCDIAKKNLKYMIDLSSWSDDIIKKNTDDNIHPNKYGYRDIANELEAFLPEIREQ